MLDPIRVHRGSPGRSILLRDWLSATPAMLAELAAVIAGGDPDDPLATRRPDAGGGDAPVAETGVGAAEGGRGTKPSAPAEGGHERRRYPWADRLRRVLAVDVFECPDCGGRMRILAAIHPPQSTRDILECLGLPSRAPPTVAARPEPEEPVPPDW